MENIAASLATHFLLLDFAASTQKAAADAASIEDADAMAAAAAAANENEAAAALDDANAPPSKATAEVIARLLEYCKKEWIWHLSGFTWLFIYSLSAFWRLSPGCMFVARHLQLESLFPTTRAA